MVMYWINTGPGLHGEETRGENNDLVLNASLTRVENHLDTATPSLSAKP